MVRVFGLAVLGQIERIFADVCSYSRWPFTDGALCFWLTCGRLLASLVGQEIDSWAAVTCMRRAYFQAAERKRAFGSS